MDSPIPPYKLRDIAKWPMAYALVILGGIASVFVHVFITSNFSRNTDCQKQLQQATSEKAELTKQLSDKNRDYESLMRELLVKNGVLDNLKPVVDSLTKRK